jgi:integrase
MSIKQDALSGKWFFRFMYKGDDYSGFGFSTKDAASKAERTARDDAEDRALFPEKYAQKAADSITLAELIEYYNRVWSPRNKSSRLDETHGSFCLAHFKEARLVDLTAEKAMDFLKSVEESDKGRDGGRPAAQTVNHYHGYMRKVINKAIKHYRTESGAAPAANNPFQLIAPRPLPEAQVRFMYPQQEKDIREWLTKHRPQTLPYYLVGLKTGVRIEGLCNIHVTDVNLPIRTIFIARAKGDKPYHARLSTDLAAYVETLGRGKGKDERLLGTLTPGTVSRYFTEAVRACGYEGLSFHSLRHTFAERLLSAGEKLYVVSKLLNHSSMRVTEKVYGHLDKSTINDAVQRLDDVLPASEIPFAVNLQQGIKDEMEKQSKRLEDEQ